MKKLFAFCAALISALWLNGCVVAFGNRLPPDGRATLGRQLIDLKTARESGAITEEEYQTAKKQLMEIK